MRAVLAKAEQTGLRTPGIVAVELDTAAAARAGTPPELRTELDAATRDIVTRSGLALVTLSRPRSRSAVSCESLGEQVRITRPPVPTRSCPSSTTWS